MIGQTGRRGLVYGFTAALAACALGGCGRHRAAPKSAAAADTSASALVDTGSLKLADVDTASMHRDTSHVAVGAPSTSNGVRAAGSTGAPAPAATSHAAAPRVRTPRAISTHVSAGHVVTKKSTAAHHAAKAAPLTIARLERNHARVRALQAALNRDGCHAGAVDGVIGSRTKKAIACSERKHGVPRGNLKLLLQRLKVGRDGD